MPEAKGNRIWIIPWSGSIYRYQPDSESFDYLKSQPGNPERPQAWSYRDAIVDRHGQLWLASDDGGLEQYDQKTGLFRPIGVGSGSDSLHDFTIWDIAEDTAQQCLWLGTERAGLARFDLRTHQVKHYSGSSDEGGQAPVTVKSIALDQAGQLWLATPVGLVMRSR
ncbi:MAG: hypothetical protein HC842_04765, partial [Cytophagales bacterium]|nr:hypothetical protein [Cytophagales bacterium]